VNKVYGPVSVIHFDSHIDTWGPRNKTTDEDVSINHGSYFWHAAREGLLAPNQANIVSPSALLPDLRLTHGWAQHVGIRGGLNNWDDYENDAEVGFHISHAGDIDEEEVGGYKGIVKKIKEVVGNNPVYSELDNMHSSEDELTADSHLGH
jgi:agmatinase